MSKYNDQPPAYSAAGGNSALNPPPLSIETFLSIMQMSQHTSTFLRNGFRSINDIAYASDESLTAMGLPNGDRSRILEAARARAPPKPVAPAQPVKMDQLKDSAGTRYLADGKGGFASDVGNTYFGENNAEGKFHGYGTYSYGNGETYTGQWVEGKRQGQGRGVRADGSVVHQGEWANNLPLRGSKGMEPVKPSFAEY